VIFNLYVIEEYKHSEIAELLNITEGTSKTQLFRARKALQKMLKTNKRNYHETQV
jgi:RNA polymerase sigma-70 factor (ECF subfamily)